MFRSVAEASYKMVESLPPAHHASYQSTSAHSDNQLVSKLHEDDQNHVHATELNNLLAHCTVLSPHELLSSSFPDSREWDIIPNERIKHAFQRELHKYKLKFTENQPLYDRLSRAFNNCCDGVIPTPSIKDYVPTRSLQCTNTSALRPVTEDLAGDPKRRAPDLCLAFDTMENYSPDTFFSHIMAAIEFKPTVTADPGFTAMAAADHLNRKKKGHKVEELSTDGAKLLLQAFAYVSAQWAEHPYRHIWSITIACNKMRFWRWSTSGVLLTEAFDYINDATPVYQLLQALGRGPYSRLGLDIGRGMTFGVPGSETEHVRPRVRNVIRHYGNVISKSEVHTQWTERALKSDIWIFEQWSSVLAQNGVPTTRSHRAPTQEDEDRPKESDTAQTSKHNQKQADGTHTLYVVSCPIWHGKGVYSRGTRCYLAVYKATLEGDNIITMEDIHMLKTSWQFTSRSPEYEFFVQAQAKNSGRVPQLVSILAGGNIEGTEQYNGQSLAESELPATDKAQEPSKGRHIQWILFKQVGERISGFRSVKELLQIIYDAIEAHEMLYNTGVLHGDISENNVIIDLSNERVLTRRGLLIDLGMARFISQDELQLAGSYSDTVDDMGTFPDSGESDSEATPDSGAIPDSPSSSNSGQRPKSLPNITGTLLFMSVAMKSKPRHQCWHDMESFYWLLLFVTLRHVQGVEVTIGSHVYSLDNAEHRELILRRIFHPPRHTNTLSDFSDSKETFLRGGAVFRVVGNRPLTTLLKTLYATLKNQYSVFSRTTELTVILQHIETSLNMQTRHLPLKDVYMVKGLREFNQQLSALFRAEERVSGKLKRLRNAWQVVKTMSSVDHERPSKIQQAAMKHLQDTNVSAEACMELREELAEWRRDMELHRDENRLAFLTHENLKQYLSEAIKKQDDISTVPSRPFRPKPIENAVRAVQNAVSRMATPESGSSEAVRFYLSRSGDSGGISSGERAGSKRKRSSTVVQSSEPEKRRKMHNGKASSSARSSRE